MVRFLFDVALFLVFLHVLSDRYQIVFGEDYCRLVRGRINRSVGRDSALIYIRSVRPPMQRAVGVGIAFSVIFGGQMGTDSLGNSVRYVLDRGYSRAQEDAADDFGVALVYHTYGKTEGVDRLFSDSRRVGVHAIVGIHMFSTHPDPSDRIRNLRNFVDAMASKTNGPAGDV